MRRIKRDDVTKVRGPFCVWVDEAYDLPGTWIAHVLGSGLDNVTQGDGPEDALAMAYDMLKTLTGYCSAEHPEHDFSIEAVIPATYFDDGEQIHGNIPAWECSRCHERWNKDCFEET